jgi:putative transposase
MWYYQSKKDDSEVIDKLNELADKLPHRGFDTYFGRIRAEGIIWNRKRVLRIYRTMKLQMRRKRKKRLPSRVREPLVLPQTMNETWSMDFMCDTLESGRRFRILNVIDDVNGK